MTEFECTCSVIKGEREIACGEDCYAYYPKPNYEERITRCRDCKYGSLTSDGKQCFCNAFAGHVLSVDPSGFCNKGKPKEAN